MTDNEIVDLGFFLEKILSKFKVDKTDMAPPPIILDAKAVSGITGSISVACWIIVFAPQIYENFCRKSSEGLSILFIILWLAGDVFNVLGSVLQGVLPTMIILAVYYTLADIVLLLQCLVYDSSKSSDYIHLSPANPLNTDVLESVVGQSTYTEDLVGGDGQKDGGEKKSSWTPILLKLFMISLVILSGLVGWYVSYIRNTDGSRKQKHGVKEPELVFEPLAQFFGWLCAVLYLGSRVPQILLNYRRKSCEGISFMFFLFACIGNLTYVISILVVDTSKKYLVVNSSWLAGSLGTLALDFTIFTQFFIYNQDDYAQSVDQSSALVSSHENTPLLS